ncbi:MAG: DNA primase [Clostridiales bacterium]|nr:DNA primase [Clostridiales bacterium]
MDEIVNIIDIVDLISDYVNLKRIGSNWMGLCPFHNDSKTSSFSVSNEKKLYHCFGCGASGSIFTFVMKIENLNFVDSVKFLASRINYILPEKISTSGQKKNDFKKIFLKINLDAAKFFFKCLKNNCKAIKYLAKRKIKVETIKDFCIGYCDNNKNLYNYLSDLKYNKDLILNSGLVSKKNNLNVFGNRIIFPIFDIYKNIIGFGARSLEKDHNIKYLNSRDSIIFKKSYILYNIDNAIKSHNNSLILVEGYFDVVSIYQSGIKNICAVLGTNLSSVHAKIIKNNFKNVILCFDFDQAGLKAIFKAIKILNNYDISTRVMLLHSVKDPDEYINKFGTRNFKEKINKSIDAIEFLFMFYLKKYDIKDSGNKIKFIREIIKVMSKLNLGDIQREVYVHKISNITDVSVDSINKEIQRDKDNNTDVSKSKKNDFNKLGLKNNETYKAEFDIINLIVKNYNIRDTLKIYLNENDFENILCKKIFKTVYLMHSEHNEINFLKIINSFETLEEQSKVANFLSSDINFLNIEKAALDILKNIKIKKIVKELRQTNDLNRIMTLTRERNFFLKMNVDSMVFGGIDSKNES